MTSGVATASRSAHSRAMLGFAEMLDYPTPALSAAVEDCRSALAGIDDEAKSLVDSFAEFAGRTGSEEMEEIYTGMFELNAACHPYVGYHLFGESYERSALMLGLAEAYEKYDISPGSELTDHLTVVLKFLAACEDEDEAGELAGIAVLPALNKMLRPEAVDEDEAAAAEEADELPQPDERLEDGFAAYRSVLSALTIVLEKQFPGYEDLEDDEVDDPNKEV